RWAKIGLAQLALQGSTGPSVAGASSSGVSVAGSSAAGSPAGSFTAGSLRVGSLGAGSLGAGDEIVSAAEALADFERLGAIEGQLAAHTQLAALWMAKGGFDQ